MRLYIAASSRCCDWPETASDGRRARPGTAPPHGCRTASWGAPARHCARPGAAAGAPPRHTPSPRKPCDPSRGNLLRRLLAGNEDERARQRAAQRAALCRTSGLRYYFRLTSTRRASGLSCPAPPCVSTGFISTMRCSDTPTSRSWSRTANARCFASSWFARCCPARRGSPRSRPSCRARTSRACRASPARRREGRTCRSRSRTSRGRS